MTSRSAMGTSSLEPTVAGVNLRSLSAGADRSNIGSPGVGRGGRSALLCSPQSVAGQLKVAAHMARRPARHLELLDALKLVS